MARDSEQGDHFDLLPFISILLCVLGCLMLVTMSMSALSLGVSAGEGWIPAPTDVRNAQKPVLVEWDGTQLTIHEDGGRRRVAYRDETVQTLRMDDGSEVAVPVSGRVNPEFTRVVGDFAVRKRERYALFAVRPSGFKTFQTVADEFREREVAVGSEPIGQAKSVRLIEDDTHGKASSAH